MSACGQRLRAEENRGFRNEMGNSTVRGTFFSEFARMGMERIRLWRGGIWFRAGDVEIHDDGFLAAADDYSFYRFVFFGI